MRLNSTDIDINIASSPGTHRRCEAIGDLLTDKSPQKESPLESPKTTSNESFEGDNTVMENLDLNCDLDTDR